MQLCCPLSRAGLSFPSRRNLRAARDMNTVLQMFNRRAVLCHLALVLVTVTIAGAQSQVLAKSDLLQAYRGRWAVPWVAGPNAASGGHDFRRTGFSTGVHIQLPDGRIGLKSSSLDLYGYSLFTPPAPRTGAAVGVANTSSFTWAELPRPSLANTPQASGTQNHGWYRDRSGVEYVSMNAYYAVGIENFPSQMRAGNGFYTLTGNTVVPDIDLPYFHNKVAGAICAPAEGDRSRWDYLLTLTNIAGAGTSSAGLSLYGVKWRADSGGVVRPFGDAIIVHAMPNHVASYWDNIFSVRGCAWIDTTVGGVRRRGIIFTGTRSKGAVWYGNGDGRENDVGRYYNKPLDWPASPLYLTDTRTDRTVSDPTGAEKGYHAEDYDRFVAIVDPAKLEKGNFQVQPEEIISLQDLGWLSNVNGYDGRAVAESSHRSEVVASYDNKTGKLLLGVENGYRASFYESAPLFLEFDFGSGTSADGAPGAPRNLTIQN